MVAARGDHDFATSGCHSGVALGDRGRIMTRCARCNEPTPRVCLARCEECGRWVCDECSLEAGHFTVCICRDEECRVSRHVRVMRIEGLREDQP